MSKKTDSSWESMFMGASTKQGYEIAAKSRKIVRSLIDLQTKNLTPAERSIVERIVHSTADPEYADITRISENFVKESLRAISDEEDILTDINMVKVGINEYAGKVKCYINYEKTFELAKKRNITRAAAAMELAALEEFEGVIVIGNSPTALWKIVELLKNRDILVKSIIGVPVGFVGAAESKEALEQSSIPYLLTRGPKGGTSVAVAAVNSLIDMVRRE
jgi:precorrin-8X/cobalt-precorrin-8 methylmutase